MLNSLVKILWFLFLQRHLLNIHFKWTILEIWKSDIYTFLIFKINNSRVSIPIHCVSVLRHDVEMFYYILKENTELQERGGLTSVPKFTVTVRIYRTFCSLRTYFGIKHVDKISCVFDHNIFLCLFSVLVHHWLRPFCASAIHLALIMYSKMWVFKYSDTQIVILHIAYFMRI